MKLKNEVENEVSLTETKEEQQRQHEAVKTELMDKLDYIGLLYREQHDGIDKRLEKCKSDMYWAIFLFLGVAVVDGFLAILLSAPGGSILGMAWEIWVAVVVLFIALIKTGKNMGAAIFTYWVQHEKRFMIRYIQKYNIFTIQEEKRYCSRKMKEVAELKKKLNDMEPGMKYTEFMDYEYIEKRADADVLDGFYNLRLW
ncbi:MAG: hypothetical protein K2G45_12115 [Lachnospiraceae bacterium]|nr:hypothetical protein [Lachnospiraceae bacterium]